MKTIEKTKDTSLAAASDKEAFEADLLSRVFEQLEDDGIPVDETTEPCVPYIIQGLRNRQYEVNPLNPLQACIGRVLDEAGVLPRAPSLFD
jgi:hypothetical protein